MKEYDYQRITCYSFSTTKTVTQCWYMKQSLKHWAPVSKVARRSNITFELNSLVAAIEPHLVYFCFWIMFSETIEAMFKPSPAQLFLMFFWKHFFPWHCYAQWKIVYKTEMSIRVELAKKPHRSRCKWLHSVEFPKFSYKLDKNKNFSKSFAKDFENISIFREN